ncbi:hypothetical protein SEA_BEUFFERT_52 [Streptomyces phage Beuffert]|nr:hypothetical protein SEA_BEUFFERT_52 [Streptomyces phage Beuffert]
MATNTVAKQAYGLISHYEKCFRDKYPYAPTVNRFRVKWGFQDMVTDLGYDTAKEVVEYYFRTAKPGHPIDFLLNNYDRINEFMKERQKDEEKREELRRQTEQKVREMEDKNDH